MSKGSDIATDGPFELTMQVHLVGENEMAGNTAKADVSLPLGAVPSEADIVRLIRHTLEQVGPDFRLPTRHEFLQNEFAERSGTGIRFAVPGPDAFSLASAIEAPSGGETAQTGSTEGESAVGSEADETPQGGSHE